MGHLRSACTEKTKYIFCSRCSSRNHSAETCPSIWRSYRIASGVEQHYPSSVSCYNCGGDGHYGDDCPLPRPIILRYRDPTAFSGENLAQKFHDKYNEDVAKFKPNFKQAKSYEPNAQLNRQSSSRSLRGNGNGNNNRNNRGTDPYSRDFLRDNYHDSYNRGHEYSQTSRANNRRSYERDYDRRSNYERDYDRRSDYDRDYDRRSNYSSNSNKRRRSPSPSRSDFKNRIHRAASSAKNVFKRNRK